MIFTLKSTSNELIVFTESISLKIDYLIIYAHNLKDLSGRVSLVNYKTK